MSRKQYLTFYSTYHTTSIALCSAESGAIIDSIAIENKQSSKTLIIVLDELLKLHNLTLKDIVFLAAYQGPAPFTSLRTVIATVNGLGYSTKLPLVGINGLETFIKEYADQYSHPLLVLLNAYCDDVYYALAVPDKPILSGALSITECIKLVQSYVPADSKLTIIGNGYELHTDILRAAFGDRLAIPHHVPEMPSPEAVAQEAYQLYHRGETHTMLTPLYLKAFSSIMGK